MSHLVWDDRGLKSQSETRFSPTIWGLSLDLQLYLSSIVVKIDLEYNRNDFVGIKNTDDDARTTYYNGRTINA